MSDPEEPAETPPTSEPSREARGAQRPPSTRIIDSETLFRGTREVWIRHGEAMYRLRVTSANRLYLSK